jgi:hypothetical protein
MPLLSWTEIGELTEKQKQRLATIQKILSAFFNEKEERIALTWAQLKQITKISQPALSKYMKELVAQNVIKGQSKVDNERLKVFYEYDGKQSFEIKGKKQVKVIETARIFHSEKGIEAVKWGYLKKGKGKKFYFTE